VSVPERDSQLPFHSSCLRPQKQKEREPLSLFTFFLFLWK